MLVAYTTDRHCLTLTNPSRSFEIVRKLTESVDGVEFKAEGGGDGKEIARSRRGEPI